MKNSFLLFNLLIISSVFSYGQDSLWTQLADLDYSRWHSSANYVDGKIYVIGGMGYPTIVEEYTIETNSWQTRSSMPTGRAFVGSGVIGNYLYIIGGAVQKAR